MKIRGVYIILFLIVSLISINLVSSGFGFDNSNLPKVIRDPLTIIFVPQYVFPHTNETIPLTTSSVWENITFQQEVTDIVNGISHVHNDRTNHTFTISESGIYNLNYDFDVEDTSVSASDIDVAGRVIYENGTEIIGSVFETDIIKQDVEVEISHNFLAKLNAGDVLIFQFIANDVDVQISTHSTFGVHPDSVTILIIKIANLP